jgi:NAD(P)-dependent dehydrogenase (short-subunit alcohol dehydrogenase family)
MSQIRTAIILGVSADIGTALAERLLADGWTVVGLARSADRLGALEHRNGFSFEPCDLADRSSVAALVERYGKSHPAWSLFISCVGTMQPIGRFFDLDFDAWEASVIVNSTAQLRVLHGLWPRRDKGQMTDIMLMAGGGTNNPVTNYSAYCLSKIALIKMCELLLDEEAGANPFIIGPGYVETRIHRETLAAGDKAGAALQKTRDFMEGAGTSMDDIYQHLLWCMAVGKAVAGGRNFSTVHDPWRDSGAALASGLAGEPDAFRLRRRPLEPKS